MNSSPPGKVRTGFPRSHAASMVEYLRTRIPDLQAVYAFGSQITGHARPDSDLDLAVLMKGRADALTLFNLSSDLADLAGCDVDLLDIRAASTVMQYQILTTGERWWAVDYPADLFEIFVLREKIDLDERRAGILEDIRQRGSVY